MNGDVLVAAASGLLAGTSACALPLYPALLNHLTRTREDPRWVSVFFTVGLAGAYFILYALFGFIAALLGFGVVDEIEVWRGRLILFGAVFSWLMAWQTLRGGVRIPTVRAVKGGAFDGYAGAIASGVVYGTVITPCNAPFLVTGILPALASSDGVISGVILLVVFSAAMGAPMLLLGWASGAALSTFTALNRNRKSLEAVSAAFLILVGAYFGYLFLLTI